MFVRLMLSSVLALSFVIVDAAAAADSATRGTLKGRTAQGYRIKVAMRGEDSIKLLDFKADLKCRDGTVLQLAEGGFLPSAVRGNGTFHEVQYGSTDTVYIQGRVKGNAVRGRLRLTDRYGKGNPCKSRWIKFQAR
jgi:hypothetical protein